MAKDLRIQDLLDESYKLSSFTLPSIKTNLNNFKLNFHGCEDSEDIYQDVKPVLPFARSELLYANIDSCRRLTADSSQCKPVYEITLQVQNNNLNFFPGDTIGLLPQNSQLDVEFIINHLNLKSQADQCYNLSGDDKKAAKIPPHIPSRSTIRYVLTHCVDLRCILKKLFLLTLSKYTEDENEKHVLKYITSKEGANTYSQYIIRQNMCILDLFKIFKSCQPPIEVLLANLQRLLPRPYSIVNSSLTDKQKIKICFSVMDIGHNRRGLTTGYLEDIILGKDNINNLMRNMNIDDNFIKDNTIKIYLRENINGFRLPENCLCVGCVNTSLLFIGPGTGVAPFIGFLEERAMLKTTQFGEVWLIFGCRNPKLDYIYEKEIEQHLKNKVINRISTAFSRVQDQNNDKYVQDCIRSNKKEVAEFIDSGALIYVCGDKKTMAAEVRNAIKECIVEQLNKSQDEAELFITQMEKDKKYLTDTWS